MNSGGICGKKRRGRVWAGCACGLVLAFVLGGCSLAASDAGAQGGADRLVGAFITAEYLDLYDMEGFLDDHTPRFTGGGEIILDHDPEYEGKLYARIDKSRGDDPADWEISFGDVKGEYLLNPLWPDEDGEESRMSLCTEGVCNIKSSVDIADGRLSDPGGGPICSFRQWLFCRQRISGDFGGSRFFHHVKRGDNGSGK